MNEPMTPIFPLHTVLFPDGILPLRVFEPRYLDMVAERIRSGGEFGVCLIRSGKEVGVAAETFEVGTLARIIDWNARSDGTLGITAQGGQRFRIMSSVVERSQLRRARIDRLAVEAPVALPARDRGLAELLRRLTEAPVQVSRPQTPQYDDAVWVGYRLAELLPVSMAEKQQLLLLDDALHRLDRVRKLIAALSAHGR
jgi:uncharacterized protein